MGIFKATSKPNYRTIFNGLIDEGAKATNDPEDKYSNLFRVSDIGCCMRQNYFKRKAGKPKDAQFYRKVNLGHMVHSLYQNYLAATRKLFGNWYCPLCGEIRGPCFLESPIHECPKVKRETSWQYSELTLQNLKLRLVGHPDGFVLLDKRKLNLIEIKTITPYYKIAESAAQVEKFVPEHLHQANAYVGLLTLDSTRMDLDIDAFRVMFTPEFFMLVYVDKGSDNTVPYDFPFDRKMFEDDVQRVEDFWVCWKKKQVPRAEPGAKCKYCKFVGDCNVEKHGR